MNFAEMIKNNAHSWSGQSLPRHCISQGTYDAIRWFSLKEIKIVNALEEGLAK